MTGKTHRVGGMLCCLGGYLLLESNGLLLNNVSPMLQLAVMYPFSIYGSIASDFDHNWQSCPSKDIISYGINKVLHLTTKAREHMEDKSTVSRVLSIFDAKHRSWQTHSDLFLLVMIWVSYMLFSGAVNSADQVIIRLIATGLTLGVISHLVLDMLTPEGIWCIITTTIGRVAGVKNMPEKISLVPNTRFFRTGGKWETLVRWVMWVICLIILLNILYNVSPYRLSFFLD